jgi:DNA-binding NarL/FixJ family response regulator
MDNMETLRELRLQRGLSQPELAELAGLNRNTISIIECRPGNHKYATMKKLAEALNVELSEIAEGHARWKQYSDGLRKKRRVTVHSRAINFVTVLSPRQLVILRLLAKGYLNEKIAKELAIRHKTVKNHLRSIYLKLKPTDEEDPRSLAIVLYMTVLEKGLR